MKNDKEGASCAGSILVNAWDMCLVGGNQIIHDFKLYMKWLKRLTI